MGTKGPLTADSLVTLLAGGLIAQGYGLPGGPPLPEDLNFLTGEPGYVLRPEEIEIIDDRVGLSSGPEFSARLHRPQNVERLSPTGRRRPDRRSSLFLKTGRRD